MLGEVNPYGSTKNSKVLTFLTNSIKWLFSLFSQFQCPAWLHYKPKFK